MFTPRIRNTIIFDLDGTLIDSLPDVRVALNHILLEAGYSPLTLMQVKTLIGHGVSYMIENAFLIFGHKLYFDDLNQYVERYLSYYEKNPIKNTTLFPFVREVLENLYLQGFNMGICSNKPYKLVKVVLKGLNMNHYFSAVVGGDNLGFRKPDPKHIYFTLEKMDKTTSEAVMVGDSETDALAARNSGIPCVLVTYGYLNDNSHIGVKLINSFCQLPIALKNL